jgi:signal transduction histidine kinase
MKKRNTVLILGIISIIVLTSVQTFLIRGIWNQKNDMFALRYTMASQEALSFIDRRMPTDGFDTVRFLLGRYSEKANFVLHSLTDDQELRSKKEEVLSFFTKAVNQEQDFSILLSKYFERRGYEKNFNYSIVINNLELIGKDTIKIYQNEDFISRRGPDKGVSLNTQENYKDKILVKWFRMEDNNYRFSFEYFINFSDKQKLILKESSASLAMSFFSILVVVVIFIITYRNLKEEKRLSNLKTDFINNMTHELKTPLSTITVAGKTLELKQIRTSEEKILETAKLIGKQSINLNQLINMILEISMWERTQFQLNKKNIKVEEILNDIINCFKSGNNNGTTINCKCNLKDVHVELDIIYFTTMINNLLSNAVKYSDKDPVIDIEGLIENKNVCIRISDNGIGINKSDQKHIFDKFYRASSGNIHKFKGLGLGLHYVRKIAEAHGGTVSVTSKPGKGSIFTVLIPF